MINKNIISILLLCLTILLLGACKDTNWDDHNEITNVDNTQVLSEKIASQANLSVFNGYLKSTGYDKLLTSSQNYTVWAPTNEAIAALDPAIVSDQAKLKDYVANHIALATYPAVKNSDTLRVELLNKKYGTLKLGTFEEASLVGTQQYVKNGVLHVIDKPVVTKQNIWDYMLSSGDAPAQTTFISTLTSQVIDSANSPILGYNTNGTPYYGPNPVLVTKNTYWLQAADLRTESQQYTFFMLQDPAYNVERAKLAPYFTGFTQYNLVFDLTVKGLYTQDKLPDTLVSVKGVKVPISKSAIVKSYRASNGIVYVVSALPFRLKDKIPTFKIEGENPLSFRTTRTVLYRTKLDNLGVTFRDVEVYNHGVAEFYINYYKATLPKVKYKVYARAISGLAGDSQVAAFTQRFFIYNNITSTPTTPVYDLFYTHLVSPLNYAEVYMGEYTPPDYGPLNLRLTSANSTSVNVNTLILDYVRFEPVLP